jgi:diguanylate cyclase (GGDEF)-like protein
MPHGFIIFNLYLFLTIYNGFGIYMSATDYQIGGQIIGMVIIMAVSYLVFNLHPIGAFISLSCYLSSFFVIINYIPLIDKSVFPEPLMMVDSMLIVYAAILYFAGIVVSIFAYKNTIKAARNQFALEELNMQLAELSMTDDLTDLSNRVALKTNLAKFYHNELNLMMIDIDNFKKLNDTYGHQIGDEVLKTFASLLVDAFGKNNVYRYGGDEFLIVSNESVIDFKKKLKHLRSKVGSYHYRGNELCFSSGYYHDFMANHEEFSKALEEADKRLYYSKNHGKNIDTATIM